jgi:hypothetical protein
MMELLAACIHNMSKCCTEEDGKNSLNDQLDELNKLCHNILSRVSSQPAEQKLFYNKITFMLSSNVCTLQIFIPY